jgi:hypothetical protein
VSLKRLESVTVGKILISVDFMNHGKVVFFAYSDGSVEYRDRHTMEEVLNDGNLEKVWHLSQIGFSYPEDDPCMFAPHLDDNLLMPIRSASCIIAELLLRCSHQERWQSEVETTRLSLG